MKARIKAMPLDDQPTFFEKELIDLMTDETNAWTKFLQPEFGTWSDGIKRASLDAIAPLPVDPYKEMTLDECRICLSWLENVFRMLNVKIREAEDDEVYTWYLESYLVVAGSREYLALNQKLVKMISLLHYVVQYSQTCFRESRRQEAALWIHENTDNTDPSAPPLEVRSMSSHSHATDTVNDSRSPSLPSYFKKPELEGSFTQRTSVSNPRVASRGMVYHDLAEQPADVAPSIKNESVTPSRRSSAQASIGTRDTMKSADPVLPQTTVGMVTSMLEQKLDQKMEGIRATLEALMASLPTTALPRPSTSQSQHRSRVSGNPRSPGDPGDPGHAGGAGNIGPNLTVGNLDGSRVSSISHSNSANLSTASNVKTYTLEELRDIFNQFGLSTGQQHLPQRLPHGLQQSHNQTTATAMDRPTSAGSVQSGPQRGARMQPTRGGRGITFQDGTDYEPSDNFSGDPDPPGNPRNPGRHGEGGNPGYGGDDEDLWDNLPSMGHQGAMHVLSMDSLPVFSGSEDNREASYQWMRRYEQLSRLSGWTEQEKIAWFPSYLSKTVRAWFNQLQPHYKQSWKDIKRKFAKEWITNPLPKADKYYRMTQDPKEPLKTFFYRFNSAAQSARVEYWKSSSILEDHIGRFCMALEDESLGDRLSQMVFSSIDDLDRHLDSQRKNQILRQFKNRQVDTTSAGIRRREMTRDKRPSMERQILLAREDSEYDSPAVNNTPKEQLHHEIYALGGKKEWCSSCSKEHWRVNGECWMEHFCSLCKRNGHPTDKCIKACQFCKPTHNKYERCETREQIISVRTYLEALAKSGKLDDLPNMDRTQATRSTPQALETQVARSSRGTLGDLASTALTPLKKKDMPLDHMALEVQEFLATVAAWKTQQEKRGRKRDLLTCNISYDPPPLVPRVFFTNSTKSLPEEFDLLEGEQLGFWRKSDLTDRARSDQAFLHAAIMNVPARILADTGANLSVIHRRMAERLNLKVDTSKRIGINGLGPNSVSTFGMVTIKLTIARGIVFIFSLAVCDIGPVEFEMILGMDFMSKAGFVIDTGNREIQLPDGEYVPLLTEGIKYETSFLSYVKLRYTMELGAGEFMTMDLPKLNDAPVNGVEYWVDRSARWVPSMCADSHGVPCAYKVTNISNKLLTLSAGTIIGAVAQVGVRPLNSRMVRTTSNRYKEWQVDVWEGSVSCKIQRMLNQMRHFNQAYEPPSVVHPSYPRPRRILRRGNQEGSASLPSITEADSDAEDVNKRDMRATSALPPNPAALPCPVLPGHPGEAGQIEPVLTMDALTVAPDDAIFSTTQQVPPTSDLDDSDPDDSTFITQAFTLLDCFPLVEHDTKPPSHGLSLDENTSALATSWWTKLSTGQSLASAFAAISSILLPHTTLPSTDRKQGQGTQGDHHDGDDPIPVDVANCLALAAQSGQGGGCAENKSEDFPSSVTAEPIPAEEPGGPGSPRTPGITWDTKGCRTSCTTQPFGFNTSQATSHRKATILAE
ncbi:hypothetical protein DYB38_002186 [Aphanomyces astaci]|uniref:Peptidase A2 domain-containing protein n=1 Tax=Aphanomyces astaci TaxID=112090 RepID=A0A397CE95_APHAT|nr:hypothetical protein DYB38_002186 [Aphanomyces astaci]